MSGGQMNCPIVFRGPNGAAARVAAQHSQDFSAWYASVPGLKVIAPYTAADAKGLLKAAIRDPSPVIFLENEILYGQSFDVPKLEDFVLPIGKARVAREGADVTIVSYSRGMAYALEAAKRLAEEGIEAEAVRLGARHVEALDAAHRAEMVFRRAGVERVGGDLVGAFEQAKALRFHHQMQVTGLPADRAIALLDLDLVGREHLIAHRAAMAAAALPGHGGFGHRAYSR
jgi:deoxyxylulose-5-phosphate synthase